MNHGLRDRLRAQFPHLSVELAELGGRGWLVLSTDLGPTSDFDPFILLRHNFDLTLGQIRFADGTAKLSQSMPVEEFDTEDAALDAEHLATQLLDERDRTRSFYGL